MTSIECLVLLNTPENLKKIIILCCRNFSTPQRYSFSNQEKFIYFVNCGNANVSLYDVHYNRNETSHHVKTLCKKVLIYLNNSDILI